MKEENTNIDNLFHDVLNAHEEDTPDYLWNNISTELDAVKYKRLWAYVRGVAAVGALILAFTAGYYFTGFQQQRLYVDKPKQATKEKIVKNKEKEEVQPASDNTLNPEDDKTSKTKSNITATNEYPPKTQQRLDLTKPYTAKLEKVRIPKETLSETDSPLLAFESTIELDSKAPKIVEKTLSNQTHSNIYPQSHKPVAKNPKLVKAMEEMLAANEWTFPSEAKNGGWEIGGAFSPMYSYRTAQLNPTVKHQKASNSYLPNGQVELDYYNYVENAMVTYAGGVNVSYNSGKRWELQTGLYYSQLGQVTEEFFAVNKYYVSREEAYTIYTSAGSIEPSFEDLDKVASRQEIINSMGDIHDENADLIQYLDYVEVPVIMQYKIIDKKIDVNLLGGVGANILVNNNVRLKSEGATMSIGKTQNIKPINYTGTLGIGVEYNISKRLSLGLEPTVKYAIRPINQNHTVQSNTYAFGVFSSVQYKLFKRKNE